MDVHNPTQRSRNMAAIRSKDTKPELIVRRVAHRLGYRFRLHRADLPGKPDLVFPRLRKVVEVRGCYWHMHTCRFGCVIPKTNADFWQRKRSSNVKRDQQNLAELRTAGWEVMIVWECETKDAAQIEQRLAEFLKPAD